jgi:hypothetical protein
MPNLEIASRAIPDTLLQLAVRLNRTGMLAKVFRPGTHQKVSRLPFSFSESRNYSPRVCPIASANPSVAMHRLT